MGAHQVRQETTQGRHQVVFHQEQTRHVKQLTIVQLILPASLGTAFRLLNVKIQTNVNLTAVIRLASMAFVRDVFLLHLLSQAEHAEYAKKVIGMVSNINKQIVYFAQVEHLTSRHIVVTVQRAPHMIVI